MIVLAAILFSCMAACIKAVSPRISVAESVFFRSLVPSIAFGFLMVRERLSFRTSHFPLLLTRSLLGLLAMSCKFYALGHLALGDTAILGSTFPIFVVLFASFFLSEKITGGLMFWILVALGGVGLILQPQFEFLNYAGLIALLSSALTALVVTVIHQLRQIEKATRIIFYFSVTCLLVSLPVMLQDFVWPDARELSFLLVAGGLATLGQFLITYAYGLEEISKLSPLSYAGILTSFILGIIFWHEVPTWEAIVGGLVVVLCCVRIIRMRKPEPIIPV